SWRSCRSTPAWSWWSTIARFSAIATRTHRSRSPVATCSRSCISWAAADMATTASETLDTPFTIGGRDFRSRLMVGTGKYKSNAEMIAAIEASGAEVVTVAVRRVDLDRSKDEGILHHLSPDRFFLLAN